MKRLGILTLGLALLWGTAARAADTVYYYYTDEQGTPEVVADAQGNVIERTQYAPYGQVLNRPEHDGPGYTGHEEDAQTGLTNMQQRYDDKVVGRFLSVDPVQPDGNTGGSFNRYAYADDNPYKFTDPDGRQDCVDKNCKDNEQRNTCTGSLTGHCDSENLKVTQVSEPSAPTSKIAHDMVSKNPADRVSAAHAAMNYFGIKPIAGQVDIMYNPNSPDYGDTKQLPNDPGHGVVILGPKAYITWSHLGSTLGHEIEVHWNTQILLFGNYHGTKDYDWREVQAYKYNLREAGRFGNTPSEVEEFKNLLGRYQNGYQNLPDETYTIGH